MKDFGGGGNISYIFVGLESKVNHMDRMWFQPHQNMEFQGLRVSLVGGIIDILSHLMARKSNATHGSTGKGHVESMCSLPLDSALCNLHGKHCFTL